MPPGTNPMRAEIRNSLLATFAEDHVQISTSEAGRLLQAKHGVYSHRTWRAFFTEWKAFNGDPPGYAARTLSSEPWISEELIHKLLTKEQGVLDQVGMKGETWVAVQLAEKYGVLSASRWRAHVLARLEQLSRSATETGDIAGTAPGGRERAQTVAPHKTTRWEFWEVVYPDDEPHNVFTQHEKEVDVNAPRPKRARRAPTHIVENTEARAKLRAEMKREQNATRGLSTSAKARSQTQTTLRRSNAGLGAYYSLASSSGTGSSLCSTAVRTSTTPATCRPSDTFRTPPACVITSTSALDLSPLTPEQMAAIFTYGTKTYIDNGVLDEVRYARSLARQWGGSEAVWYAYYDRWYSREEPFCALAEQLQRGWSGRASTPPPPYRDA